MFMEDFENNKFQPVDEIDSISDFKMDSLRKKETTDIVISNEEQDTFNKIAKDFEDEDFFTARKNILNVINKGPSVLQSMISLAEASDHPRAFEVVATLMKTLTEANKDLLDLHDKKLKLSPTENQTNIQNNHLHVGTTAELLELIRDKSKHDGAD